MKILFICGVTNAGKSTTIRRSIQFLNVDVVIKSKFLNNRSPPKIIEVDGKTVCVYLDSPQEATSGPDEAVEYLKDKIGIAQKYNTELLVTAFNILDIHDEKTDACLHWLKSSGHKPSTFFTYLDSNTNDDVSARIRIGNMRNNGFNILPTINRSAPDEQGEKFANYIRQLL
jgi:hypothetical protein